MWALALGDEEETAWEATAAVQSGTLAPGAERGQRGAGHDGGYAERSF